MHFIHFDVCIVFCFLLQSTPIVSSDNQTANNSLQHRQPNPAAQISATTETNAVAVTENASQQNTTNHSSLNANATLIYAYAPNDHTQQQYASYPYQTYYGPSCSFDYCG